MDSQNRPFYTNLLHGNSDVNEDDFLLGSFVQTTELLVEPTPSSPIFTQKPIKKKVACLHNFTTQEDCLLVSAWLNVSLDPVHSNDQSRNTYWCRISEEFHTHKTFHSERKQTSLILHWSTINLATNKFCGCYAQIESRRQSGKTEQDKIQDVKLLYQECHGSTFPFEHCWNMLRYQPK